MERHGMVDYFRSIGFDKYPFLQQFIPVDDELKGKASR
jgi:hypothetical protein